MDSRKITGWSEAWLPNHAGGKIKHHEDGRNLHGTRVSSIQPKPFWMRIWMRNPSPRYYVKASCDLRQEEQVGIIQNVLTAPKHLYYSTFLRNYIPVLVTISTPCFIFSFNLPATPCGHAETCERAVNPLSLRDTPPICTIAVWPRDRDSAKE